jgi:hypothetical protein
MGLETVALVDSLLLVLVVVGMGGGAIYLTLHDRRLRRVSHRLVGTADIPVGLTPDELAKGATGILAPPPRQPPRRVFYERIGLERGVEMKMCLYSLNDCESELELDSSALRRDGFVAALKAYLMLEDEWLDASPRKAADLLRLAPREHEVDEEHKAILLRRLPHGFPSCARDCL